MGGESIDIGANPSAEEGEEAVDDNTQMVLDVAHSFRLQETSFDKKSYLSHLKSTFPKPRRKHPLHARSMRKPRTKRAHANGGRAAQHT